MQNFEFRFVSRAVKASSVADEGVARESDQSVEFVFVLSQPVQAITYGNNYGSHGTYGLDTGRYGVNANTQNELAQIMALANSCGFPLNVDPNLFASQPTTAVPPVTTPGKSSHF
ncbi:MAG: hypothetical protein R3B54_07800 [Bdellovibrionota bacterium]